MSGNGVRAFGPGVAVGNWNEDRYLHEEKDKDILAAHSSGSLGFQRTENAIKKALAPSAVHAAVEGLLSYGDRITLHSAEADSVLSILPSIRPPTKAGQSTQASGASTQGHLVRNVFEIVPGLSNGNPSQAIGQPVRFGDLVCLKGINPFEDTPLVLWSEKPSLSTPVARFSGEQKVEFQDPDSIEDKRGIVWIVVAADASYRPELEGEPIATGTEILLKHNSSGQYLSCLHRLNKRIPSDFGSEMEVTCSMRTTGKAMGEPILASEHIWIPRNS